DEWTKGKAGYKLLQYMSMAIPPVVSPVGFNREIVKDGVNGFLADTDEEWVEKISLLIEDKNLREKIGKNARATIENNYSLIKASDKLFKIFEKSLR
ncbi:MAG: glycosyltransferase, partial [Candidatus Staskawiczbacteria bacterium]|nr:glycosyltransferase [Candidatus Staskawiczbacteria bacterium]